MFINNTCQMENKCNEDPKKVRESLHGTADGGQMQE